MPAFKKARYTDEPAFIDKDGDWVPYVTESIVTHRDAYAASLHVLFKHIADFHILMIETIAEKYGLEATDIIKTMQDDPKYKEMRVDPIINSLLHFDKKDLEKHIPVEAITAKMEKVAITKDDTEEAPKEATPKEATPKEATPKEALPKKKIVRKVVKKVASS